MRMIRGSAFVSLDGVMQAPGPSEDPIDGFNHGGWLPPAGRIEHGWAGPQSTSAREQARQRASAEDCW